MSCSQSTIALYIYFIDLVTLVHFDGFVHEIGVVFNSFGGMCWRAWGVLFAQTFH